MSPQFSERPISPRHPYTARDMSYGLRREVDDLRQEAIAERHRADMAEERIHATRRAFTRDMERLHHELLTARSDQVAAAETVEAAGRIREEALDEVAAMRLVAAADAENAQFFQEHYEEELKRKREMALMDEAADERVQIAEEATDAVRADAESRIATLEAGAAASSEFQASQIAALESEVQGAVRERQNAIERLRGEVAEERRQRGGEAEKAQASLKALQDLRTASLEAEEKLTSAGLKDGMFLVRTRGDMYALSLCADSQFEHHVLKSEGGSFTLNGNPLAKMCPTLPEAIALLSSQRDEQVAVQLTTPVGTATYNL
jgi:hypothetical protein